MDIDKAVRNFLSLADQFGQLLLVTDNEVEELYGEEVAAALAKLERINQEKQICSGCDGFCCWKIGCDLYDTRFKRCPVNDFRPLACRFHFCDSFYTMENELVMDLADIFYNSFLALSARDSDKASEMISPLLAGASPQLTAALSLRMGEMRRGEIDPELAEEFIRREVETYRTARNTGKEVC